MGAGKFSGVGRLGTEPELKFTPSGAAVCSARVVFQDRYRDNQLGEWKDGDALWVNLITWRQQAENFAESFRKGDDVIVLDGKLKVREFELRDGSKGYAIDVTVQEFGPSARWHAAKSARVDREANGPAGGDPWGNEPPAYGQQQDYQQPPQSQQARPPQGQQRGSQPARGQWQASGQPVQPTPQNYGQQQFPDNPPF